MSNYFNTQINTWPSFQANQVLTSEALNNMVDFLLQQEHYTRNKLIGIGIVCGLSFDWTTAGANATVVIQPGCGISSMGYLAAYNRPLDKNGTPTPYTHYRPFTTLYKGWDQDVPATQKLAVAGVKELLTAEQFAADTTLGKALISDAFKTDHVLVLYIDTEELNSAKCLDESCDEKGKTFRITLRPLLIPETNVNLFLQEAPNTTLIEQWDDQQNLVTYIEVNRLFGNAPGNINNAADLQKAFENAVTGAYTNAIAIQDTGKALSTLYASFKTIFDRQLNTTISPFLQDASGTMLPTFFQGLIGTPGNEIFIQYVYDFIRDIADAYNELYEAICDLLARCCPDEALFPMHLMLGKPLTAAPGKKLDVGKYTGDGMRFHNTFIPSPALNGQHQQYEKVQLYIQRLNDLLTGFDIAGLANKETIKVIPSHDYDAPLGNRVTPYYYEKVKDDLQQYWQFENALRNKTLRNSSYYSFRGKNNPAPADFFITDTAKNNFYRIEGHLGKNIDDVVNFLTSFIQQQNLPFKTIKIQLAETEEQNNTCSFPDLQEDYDLLRERTIGLLRKALKIIKDINDKIDPKETEIKKYLEELYKRLKECIDILQTPCIDQFDYDAFKKMYTELLTRFFELFLPNDNGDTIGKPNKQLNTLVWVLNNFLFIYYYKLYRAWLHRSELLQQSSTGTQLILHYSGIEHLAGVRRSETLLLVYDDQNRVIADFNLPGSPGCGCGCIDEDCHSDKKPILLQPIQHPFIIASELVEGQDIPTVEKRFDAAEWLKADTQIQSVKFTLDGKKTDKLSWKQDGDEDIFTYNFEPRKERNSYVEYGYTLITTAGEVDGNLFILITGLTSITTTHPTLTYSLDLAQNNSEKVYAYDVKKYKGYSTQATYYTGNYSTEAVGDATAPVYTTTQGNKVAILKDDIGYYFRVLSARVSAVEEVPFRVQIDGDQINDILTLNVVPVQTKLTNNLMTGQVLDSYGNAVANARVYNATTQQEVFTDANGNYTINTRKAGEVIEIQKESMTTYKLQTSNQAPASIQLTAAAPLNKINVDNIIQTLTPLIKNINLK